MLQEGVWGCRQTRRESYDCGRPTLGKSGYVIETGSDKEPL